MTSRIGVVLLGAGASSRMGQTKQLMEFRGKPLIAHAVETALACDCEKVFVVLGANSPEIGTALAALPVEIVENPAWEGGMGTSIRAGVRAAEKTDLDGLILGLVDQPLVSSAILNRLIGTWRATGKPIVASQYAGTVGVPVFFARSHFPQLLALGDSQGCKGVILSHAKDAIRLDCPEAEADVDTPQDFERVSNL